jgi:nitrogen fixation/metabolism regulation signal transduction histidine kinase
LQNAQDATQSVKRDGDIPVVQVSTQWLAAKRLVRLTVQDSGTGFPEHILKRAFEPYVTTKDKGTGLGLAVVKKIADEHGTRVDISNRVEGAEIIGAQVSLSFAADDGVF